MPLPHRALAYGSAALFAGCAVTEVANAATGGQFWAHMTPISSSVSIGASLVWLAAAASLVKRPTWGWYPTVIGTLVALAHGFVLMVAENRLGSLLFLATGVVGALASWRLVMPHHGQLSGWFVPRSDESKPGGQEDIRPAQHIVEEAKEPRPQQFLQGDAIPATVR